MAAPTAPLLDHFRQNGWVVVPDVLTAAEVESYRAAMDADREANPLEWPLGHTYSCGAAASGVLARTDAFDKLASLRESPVRAVVERLFAPHEPHLCSLSFFVRDANPTPPGGDPTDPLCVTRVWHREFVGQVGLAPESEFFVSSLQCFYYLDDALDTRGHTLACVPESVEAKRAIPIQTDGSGRTTLADDERQPPWPQWERWRDSLGRDQDVRTDGVDVFVPAGAAVLMNNTNFHAGAVRQTTQQRRTISAVYRPEEPLTSSHGIDGSGTTGLTTVHEFRESLPERLRAGARL